MAKEAETLVKKYFDVMTGFSPEVVAVGVLWIAAKVAGAPRPLEDFLKCSKAGEEGCVEAEGGNEAGEEAEY